MGCEDLGISGALEGCVHNWMGQQGLVGRGVCVCVCARNAVFVSSLRGRTILYSLGLLSPA